MNTSNGTMVDLERNEAHNVLKIAKPENLETKTF